MAIRLLKGVESGGYNPAMLAAAALYLASKRVGEQKTQQAIARAAGTSEVGLRVRIRDLKRRT